MAQQQDALMNLMTRGTKKVPTPWEQRMAPVDDTQILPGVGRDPISDTNRALYQDDKEAYNRKIYPRQMETEDRARLGYGSAQEAMEDQHAKQLELKTAPVDVAGRYNVAAQREAGSGDLLKQRMVNQGAMDLEGKRQQDPWTNFIMKQAQDAQPGERFSKTRGGGSYTAPSATALPRKMPGANQEAFAAIEAEPEMKSAAFKAANDPKLAQLPPREILRILGQDESNLSEDEMAIFDQLMVAQRGF